MFRAQRLRRAVNVAVKTLPRALFKAPLGKSRHSTTDGKGATGGRRMNEEEARKATWRCGKRTYGQTSEQASERAIDSARARARGDLRVKNDTRGFSLSELCRRLRSPGFLGDATNETDNYRNRTPRLRKTTQRARDVIVQAARSVPLRHFDLSSFALPPSFSSSFRARIEAARRDPESRVSKSHLARESLPSLFPGDSFSRSFTAVAAGATSPFYLLARPPRRVGFLISE